MDSRTVVRVGLLATTGLLVANCSENTPVEVLVVASSQIRFDPTSVEVKAGGTVTWRFESVPHNVFFLSGPQPPGDIPEQTQNTSVSRTFTTPGTYDYECRIHPGMSGSVVVTAAGGSGPY